MGWKRCSFLQRTLLTLVLGGVDGMIARYNREASNFVVSW